MLNLFLFGSDDKLEFPAYYFNVIHLNQGIRSINWKLQQKKINFLLEIISKIIS